MDYNRLVKLGVAQGVGTAFVVFMVRTLDKKLAAALTIKSALVLIGSVTIAKFGLQYAENEGYLG